MTEIELALILVRSGSKKVVNEEGVAAQSNYRFPSMIKSGIPEFIATFC